MSAKDPRRSISVNLPERLRKFVWKERRLGRSASASAALRRIVERQLSAGISDHGMAPRIGGQAYRLQLGRSSRAHLAALCRETGFSEEYAIIQLVAAAAIREQ